MFCTTTKKYCSEWADGSSCSDEKQTCRFSTYLPSKLETEFNAFSTFGLCRPRWWSVYASESQWQIENGPYLENHFQTWWNALEASELVLLSSIAPTICTLAHCCWYFVQCPPPIRFHFWLTFCPCAFFMQIVGCAQRHQYNNVQACHSARIKSSQFLRCCADKMC